MLRVGLPPSIIKCPTCQCPLSNWQVDKELARRREGGEGLRQCFWFIHHAHTTIDKVKKMSSINSFRILICLFVIYVYISPRTKMKMKSHLTGNLNLNN